jgi:hypothetical protein
MGGQNVGNTNIGDIASVIVSTTTSIGFVNLFDTNTTTMLSSLTNVEMLGYEAFLQMRSMYNTQPFILQFFMFQS